MRVTIERFRVLLVTAAALLLVVVGVFLALAQYRSHRLLRDLPAKLGADIQKETNSFTYSQAVQGRTVFTIHAARAVQRANGKVTLHDVGIVLYGRDQARVDRIYGDAFDYDQKAGVVQAAGEVHLDLQATAPADARSRAAYAAGEDESHGSGGEAHDPGIIHVRTRGLTYQQRTGIVSTEQGIEFTVHGTSGHALGATYNTAQGEMVLDHDVQLSGVRDDRPMLLTASHAAMDRDTRILQLNDARYVTVGETGGGRDARQEGRARHLRVTITAEGKAARAEATDGVSLENARGTMRAPQATVQWDDAGRPKVARMKGGWEFTSKEPLTQAAGRAVSAEATFDANGRAETAALMGAVEVWSQARASATDAWSSRRELRAERVDTTFGATKGVHRDLQRATARGGVRCMVSDAAHEGRGSEQTNVEAEQMSARFVPGSKRPELQALDGSGNTVLDRKLADGSEDRSTGDSFAVEFGSSHAGTATPRSGRITPAARGVPQIVRAVQRGDVSIYQTGAMRNGQREPLEAHAGEAQFDGEEMVHLLGRARVTQAERTLEADRIDVRRGTGDVSAQGSVLARYAQPSGGDLVHVLAARAEFAREQALGTFHGGANGAAGVRAWQGGSQIEAPTLELRQRTGELLAFGSNKDEAGVHTVLSSTRSGAPALPGSKISGQTRGPVRVTSSRLAYSSTGSRVAFTGGVVLQDGDTTLRSQEALATLQSAAAKGGSRAVAPGGAGTGEPAKAVENAFPAGSVERIEATGGVSLDQPGREARGDKVVYTAADGEYLLTGAPSSVTDAANGTVQGSAIRFFAEDRSVVVVGDPSHGAEGRVRSVLKVKTAHP